MEKELEKLRDVIKKEYENLFEKWKDEYEEKIREDSRKKSLATILGKVGEEIKLNRRILGISEPPLTILLLKGYLIRIGKKR
jgi:predicted transcriptional regulator